MNWMGRKTRRRLACHSVAVAVTALVIAFFGMEVGATLTPAQKDYSIKFPADADPGKDYAKAARWNEKAAALGWAEAQQLLAVQYANGQGFTRDRKKALDLALKAADKGSASAMRLLSWLYAEGGDGVETNYAQTAKWLRRSVE